MRATVPLLVRPLFWQFWVPGDITLNEIEGQVAGSNLLIRLWRGALESAFEDTQGLWELSRGSPSDPHS